MRKKISMSSDEAKKIRDAQMFEAIAPTWISRLMTALELAFKMGIDIEPKEGKFLIVGRILTRYEYILNPSITVDTVETDEDNLYNFEKSLQTLAASRESVAENMKIKQAALAKLNEEELKILGLI